MPRKVLIRDNFFPYHVTNRTRERVFYQLDMQELWQVYADHLKIVCWAYGAVIHSFVLMSNHYHLLISTPYENIDEITQFFQSQVSSVMFKKTQSKACFFDTRYRWTLIRNKGYFINSYRYVYQNPLRAGLSKNVEDYSFSSFHGIMGYSKLEIPVSPHPFMTDLNLDLCQEEKWLNTLIEAEDLSLIRKGLRRFEFTLAARDRSKLQKYM